MKDTSSASRIFLERLFQSLNAAMTIKGLSRRLESPAGEGIGQVTKRDFAGLFPTDKPSNAEFAVAFYKAIGLSKLGTHLKDFLRELKSAKSTRSGSGSFDSGSTSSDIEDGYGNGGRDRDVQQRRPDDRVGEPDRGDKPLPVENLSLDQVFLWTLNDDLSFRALSAHAQKESTSENALFLTAYIKLVTKMRSALGVSSPTSATKQSTSSSAAHAPIPITATIPTSVSKRTIPSSLVADYRRIYDTFIKPGVRTQVHLPGATVEKVGKHFRKGASGGTTVSVFGDILMEVCGMLFETFRKFVKTSGRDVTIRGVRERGGNTKFDMVFALHNSERPKTEIDLHSLSVRDAMTRLENRIAICQSERIRQLAVITGSGVHSEGGVARIKEAVETFAKRERMRFGSDKQNLGVVLLDIDGEQIKGFETVEYIDGQRRHIRWHYPD
ncbi:hypothetical protein HDV00_002376 [Rhizophlyctis rosea]|nr:hypothetical protein HDV00_002376 [Rhizophlyctis rosea]